VTLDEIYASSVIPLIRVIILRPELVQSTLNDDFSAAPMTIISPITAYSSSSSSSSNAVVIETVGTA